MKPYYESGGITIYHGDAREAIRSLEPPPSCTFPLALVTDPPYGTGWVRGGGGVGEFTAKHEQPEWDVWSTDWLSLSTRVVAGAVFSPLNRADEVRAAVRSGRSVYWRKTNPRPNGPALEAITVWPTCLPDGIEFSAYNGDTPLHPCQKPIDLMQWVLGFVAGHPVLDPFMGSGTTLVAAKNLGREAIGIEANEAYCEIAAERLSQEVLNFSGVSND